MSHPSNKYGLTYAPFMVYMRSSVHVLALYKILHLVLYDTLLKHFTMILN